MAQAKPFRALRPKKQYASGAASLPYDVVNEAEARSIAADNPLSFIRVVRPEINFDEGYDFSENEVYEKAAQIIAGYEEEGIYKREKKDCFYIYRQISRGRIQTGLVACFAVDDYLSGNIKEHEATRKDKEEDRIRHIDICNANTGMVYLAYKRGKELRRLLEKETHRQSLYDFITDDTVRHILWKVDNRASVKAIAKTAGKTGKLYIADGHHRAASAAKVCLKRRQENPEYTGQEDFNYFLAAAFPKQELNILPYYRVVSDLNGLEKEEFFERISEKFTISTVSAAFTDAERARCAYQCSRKGEFAMFLDGCWYRLNAKEEILKDDPVGVLDVSILQENLLGPVLGIEDPRTDKRIDFVGGVRGMAELEKRCREDMRIAFALYPTSMDELMAVADAGLYMPPKSTWFEPKLLSGLVVHTL